MCPGSLLIALEKLGFLHYLNWLKEVFIRMVHPESPREDLLSHHLSMHGDTEESEPSPCLLCNVNMASKSGLVFVCFCFFPPSHKCLWHLYYNVRFVGTLSCHKIESRNGFYNTYECPLYFMNFKSEHKKTCTRASVTEHYRSSPLMSRWEFGSVPSAPSGICVCNTHNIVPLQWERSLPIWKPLCITIIE